MDIYRYLSNFEEFSATFSAEEPDQCINIQTVITHHRFGSVEHCSLGLVGNLIGLLYTTSPVKQKLSLLLRINLFLEVTGGSSIFPEYLLDLRPFPPIINSFVNSSEPLICI